MIEKILLLLVDDDEVDRMVCIKSLRELSSKIVEATTGTEAMKCLQSESFDCIVLDYLLPDFDGLSLIKKIRNIGYKVPIVVTTGHGDELLAVEMIKAGAQDYIPKDKIEECLARSIENAIELSKVEREKEYYTNFYNNAPIGFSTATLYNGIFIKTNPALLKMFDCDTFEELAEFPVSYYYKNPEQRQKLINKITKDGIIHDFEIEIVTRKGNIKWLSVTGKLCKGSCHLEGICLPNCAPHHAPCIEASVLDITEQKKLELEIQMLKEEEIISLKEIQIAVAERLKEFE